MRLAIYCPDFYPSVGGYSFAFQDLAKGLCAEGATVDIFTTTPLNGAQEMQLPGLSLNRLQFREPFKYIKYLRALWNIVVKPKLVASVIFEADRQKNYDAILFETIEDPLVILALPDNVRLKCVVRVHACAETELAMWDPALLWRFKRWLISRALNSNLRLITATSDYYIKFVCRHFLKGNVLKIADKRFSVIPNSAPHLASSPRSCQKKDSRLHFMTLGRMNWIGANQKGFDDILMALMEMSPTQRSNIMLTIIGQGEEQSRLKAISACIPDVEIKFISSLSNIEVRQLLAEVDGVILASHYEGMSVFALEAIGSGAPVIFSNAGGIADLVHDNGQKFIAGDSRSLAIAWGKLLSTNREDWQKMSQASLDIAAQLTPELAAKKLINFISVSLAHATPKHS